MDERGVLRTIFFWYFTHKIQSVLLFFVIWLFLISHDICEVYWETYYDILSSSKGVVSSAIFISEFGVSRTSDAAFRARGDSLIIPYT